jgi:hypothetical protein
MKTSTPCRSQIVRPVKSAARLARASRASGLLTALHFTCGATGKSFDYEVPNDAGSSRICGRASLC